VPPERAAEFAALDRRIYEIEQASDLGRDDEVAAALPALEAELERAGHQLGAIDLQQLVARRAMIAGDLDTAATAYAASYAAARAARDPELAAQAAAGLVYVHGYFGNDFERGEDWAQIALAEAATLPGSPALGAVHDAVSTLAGLRGQADRAIEHAEALVEISERLRGRDHHMFARALDALGGAFDEAGRHDDAVRAYREAIAIAIRWYGEVSEVHANILLNLATAESSAGDHAAGDRDALRAAEILAAVGADPRGIGMAYLNLSAVRLRDGRPAEALGPLEAARAAFAGVGDTAMVAMVDTNAGVARRDLLAGSDDPKLDDQAVSDLERAVAGLTEAWGADHPDTAFAQAALARLHASRSRCAAAEPLARAALATFAARAPHDARVSDANEALAACDTPSRRGD
jgi:tetratricopeptide (TPR) repeat protein